MTYSLFLLLFLCLPTVALLLVLRGRIARHHAIGLGLVNLLAFVYTTPWDNFAAYKKLWTFAPAFVWGKPFWFGYLPLEEYLFYFAEAIFVCVTMLVLAKVRFLAPESPLSPQPPFPPRKGRKGEPECSPSSDATPSPNSPFLPFRGGKGGWGDRGDSGKNAVR